MGTKRATLPVVKWLADPGSCGVRLGRELRMAAEREAHRSELCLSHWIKRTVAEKLGFVSGQESNRKQAQRAAASAASSVPLSIETSQPTAPGLDSEYSKHMEKLNEI